MCMDCQKRLTFLHSQPEDGSIDDPDEGADLEVVEAVDEVDNEDSEAEGDKGRIGKPSYSKKKCPLIYRMEGMKKLDNSTLSRTRFPYFNNSVHIHIPTDNKLAPVISLTNDH